MQIAMIGLGRMGMNMARRLLRAGHQVHVYNRTSAKTEQLAKEGATPAFGVEELVGQLSPPRVIWIMLPAGSPIDNQLEALAPLCHPMDIIIDGGNSHYKDDLRRSKILEQKDIVYMDVGVSGGIWGLERGYCLMIGGDKKTYEHLEPIFQSLAPKDGYLYCGPTGAGHFVKMVHNGIEYAMLQAYGEGFELLDNSPYSEHLDYEKLAHLWNQGSVIRSWLLELAESAFSSDPRLSEIKGYVEDSGEGRWTVMHAIESAIPATVITHSLFQRFRSRQENTFSDRLIAALRKEFGGHPTIKR